MAHPSHKIRVLTDVGPMKRFLCELPLNVVELCNERVQIGVSNGNKRGISDISSNEKEITLPGYDNFGQTLFEANDWVIDTFRRKVMTPVLQFFEPCVPFYLSQSQFIRPIILIERKTEPYFRQAYADKQSSYWTSGNREQGLYIYA